MAFAAASIGSITDDTGFDNNDFITEDRTLTVSGFAIGTGTMGFWLVARSADLAGPRHPGR
jgi:hypothetical protein